MSQWRMEEARLDIWQVSVVLVWGTVNKPETGNCIQLAVSSAESYLADLPASPCPAYPYSHQPPFPSIPTLKQLPTLPTLLTLPTGQTLSSGWSTDSLDRDPGLESEIF